MDDLDRLFRRVVHNVRAAYPELLTQSFEISQLYQQVVPYRLNRRELGVESVEDYELALMQLLSGARGYLTGDADMQRALQDELESLNPDLSAYRGYATSRVALAADAVRVLDQQPMAQAAATPAAAVSATPGKRGSLSPESSAVAARTTERMRTTSGSTTPDSPGARRAAATHQQPSAAMSLPPKSAPSGAAATSPSKTADAAGDAAAATACRYCGGSLPHGKNIVFCPYCGHDLTVQHCPACNTELDIGWRFCITCGRQVS